MSFNWSFRGFDATGQKGWVYGDLVHNQKVTCEGLEPRVMVGGYEVVPESVGICTGVHSTSGGLRRDVIYEGDILLGIHVGEGIKTPDLWRVTYMDGTFYAVRSRFYDARDYSMLSEINGSVVGNMFRNRELMKINNVGYGEKEEVGDDLRGVG